MSLLLLLNQVAPTDGARFTGTYNVVRQVKPAAQRQRIALRRSVGRMASGVIELRLSEPPDQADGRREEEEVAVLFALMG